MTPRTIPELIAAIDDALGASGRVVPDPDVPQRAVGFVPVHVDDAGFTFADVIVNDTPTTEGETWSFWDRTAGEWIDFGAEDIVDVCVRTIRALPVEAA